MTMRQTIGTITRVFHDEAVVHLKYNGMPLTVSEHYHARSFRVVVGASVSDICHE